MPTCPSCAQENPDIAHFCLSCGKRLAPEAPGHEELRVVSVIFVDLVGFTSTSETLDPEDVRAILTPYYERVRAEIQSFGGLVEKFIGDAVMGVFGIPTTFGDDPERAVRAALAIRDWVTDQTSDAKDLAIRIAVNTGDALVSLGARPEHGEAMIAGDVVNTASRLQGAAPVNGILVGADTYACTRHVIAYEAVEPVLAKGKVEPVEAWLVIASAAAPGERPVTGSPLVGRVRSERPVSARPAWGWSLHATSPNPVAARCAVGRCRTTRAARTARSRPRSRRWPAYSRATRPSSRCTSSARRRSPCSAARIRSR
jgi:class 3 adenylate cyclase